VIRRFYDLGSLLDAMACIYECPSLSVHAMATMHPGVTRQLRAARVRTVLAASGETSEVCRNWRSHRGGGEGTNEAIG